MFLKKTTKTVNLFLYEQSFIYLSNNYKEMEC